MPSGVVEEPHARGDDSRQHALLEHTPGPWVLPWDRVIVLARHDVQVGDDQMRGPCAAARLRVPAREEHVTASPETSFAVRRPWEGLLQDRSPARS